MAQRFRVFQRSHGVGRLAGLADRHHQRTRVGHAVAVAVFACHFHIAGDLRNALQPVFGGEAAVVAGAAGENQHAVHAVEHAGRVVAKQIGHDAFDALQRVANGARLLEDFLLHVVPIRPQLHRAGMRVHRAHRALRRDVAAVSVADPHAAQLQVHHVAFFEVDDLVGYAGQRHRVAGEEVLALADAHDQWRPRTRADHAVRLVMAEHGDGVGALQPLRSGLHGGEQVAVVEMVDQMGDDFGVGLAFKVVAAGAQLAAQRVVVFDDAVVDERDAVAAEVRVRVDHRRRAVRGPACVRDAGEAFESGVGHLARQLGDAANAARPLQRAIGMHGHAAGVIATVFQPLEALNQDRGDVARCDRADDATHGVSFASGAIACFCRSGSAATSLRLVAAGSRRSRPYIRCDPLGGSIGAC